MGEIVLEVTDLQIDYKIEDKELPVVQNINFIVEKGKTLGIVGESGCGKSVTASSIMQLLPKGIGKITNGQICFQGKDIAKLTEKEMQQIRGNEISMIFQNPMTSLNPVYKIGNQLMEILRAHEKISRKEAYQKSVDMLKKVGIPEAERRMKEYPHQLSGGMRQRVMIAMALSTNPSLLIADEPTTALDVTIQAQVLSLIEQLQKDYQTACLFITHDMGVIAEIADYVLVMYAGNVVEYDTVEGLFSNPIHPYSRGLLQSIPRSDRDVEKLYTIKGVVPMLGELPKGCKYQDRCSSCIQKCREQTPPLMTLSSGKKVACWIYAGEEGGVKNESLTRR